MKQMLLTLLLLLAHGFISPLHQSSHPKCLKDLDEHCSCSGPFAASMNANSLNKEQISRGAVIQCTSVKNQEGFTNILKTLNGWILRKSVLFPVDDVSFSHATTLFKTTHSNITQVGKGDFAAMVNLQHLNLSCNDISRIHRDAFTQLKYLKVLDLSQNQLTFISPRQFYFLYDLANLSLSHNQLQILSGQVFQKNHKLSSLNLVGNPWFCSEGLVWLDQWIKESLIHHLVDSSKLICNNSSTKAEIGVALRTGLRNIIVRNNILKSKTCNQLCSCYPENGFPIVDCRDKDLIEIPKSIPKNTRNVYLNNNKITKIVKSYLISESWKNVHLLDLRNNSLRSINHFEGLKLLRSLGALDISNNLISHVPIHLLKQMKKIQVLKFSGNPWKCDCNTVIFQRWLQEQHSRVKDWDNVRCSKDNQAYSNKAIYTLRKTALCVVKSPESVHYLDILSIVMAILIMLIVGRLLYDYWSQKRTGQLPTFSKLL